MLECLKHHYPEYLMEAAGLAVFMVSAGVFGTLLFSPDSLFPHVVTSPFGRRLCMGILMGLTAGAIIYSPWGRQSGAHLNPSVTLTFWTLGKIKTEDAIFYVLFQFLGGILGVLLVLGMLKQHFSSAPVSYVHTAPGAYGTGAAFAAELLISFILMSVVLKISNHKKLSSFTGVFAGALVASYITLEAPISGMSMNPARTLASALPGQLFDSLWVYFTAPIIGMLLAAALYRISGRTVYCAKFHHFTDRRCIFCCRFDELLRTDNHPNARKNHGQ